MALKKSELYSSLWQSCDELRGGMDASQYKDYVLVLLFIKYVSDKYAGVPFAPITIPTGASFTDMVALKGKPTIGDDINKKIVGPLAQANKLSDMPDFNDATKLGSGKEMVDRLTNLVAIFENPALDFSKNRADGDDILGDAYEYLMRQEQGAVLHPGRSEPYHGEDPRHPRREDQRLHHRVRPDLRLGLALAEGGRRGGHGRDALRAGEGRGHQRPGPHEHDPAQQPHGAHRAGEHAGRPEVSERHLAQDLRLRRGQSAVQRQALEHRPGRRERPAQALHPLRCAARKQGDYAYLLHIVRSMKSAGKGACILPHGVLFRGNAEAAIRRNLVQRGYIKGIIGLPANLFYGTGIPACIVVIDKENAAARKGIFMIDASKGFAKDGPKNRLRAQDIHRIVDTFARQADVPRYARMVPVSEIADAKNDYNLNLPRYIDSTEPEDIQDLAGHLRGGIPGRDLDALERYWQVLPSVRAALFSPSAHAGYWELTSPDVRSAILGHAEFAAFRKHVSALFAHWRAENSARLRGFGADAASSHPAALVHVLSESLLAAFADAPLLGAYDIYQHLMDYWDETMQDDCYLIFADGWRQAAVPRLVVEEKGKKNGKERPDLVVGKRKYRTELIPPALVVARYFAAEQAAIEKLEADVAVFQQQLEELAEEHGVEGGLLDDARNDKERLTRASVAARLKEVRDDADAADERALLLEYLGLSDQETTTNGSLKAAQDGLAEKVLQKYAALTDGEIRTLVVDDKWLATLAAAVQGELDRVSQTLTGRIRQLAERYATPLPQLVDKVALLASRVDAHLATMGRTWK